MSCERYKASLIDAALGALEPARDAELRAHLAECAACRAAFEEERRLAVAIDHGLQRSVAAEPSPEFAARVRMRIAEEGAPGRSWFAGWIPTAAGALAVLLLLAFWMTRRETVQPGKGQESAQRQPAIEQPAVPSEPLAASERGPRKRTVPLGKKAAPREPEVLVPAGQWEAILRLYETVQNPRVDASALLEKPKEKLEIVELKIAPLEIVQLESDSKPSEPARDR